jgi:hypothetical protein
MNARDFKEGVAKLRRDMEQREKQEKDGADVGESLRRSEMRLELIFNAVKEAAYRGERHVVLGDRFGPLDWYVLQTLHQSGCRSEPVYLKTEDTEKVVETGCYRIMWNPTK